MSRRKFTDELQDNVRIAKFARIDREKVAEEERARIRAHQREMQIQGELAMADITAHKFFEILESSIRMPLEDLMISASEREMDKIHVSILNHNQRSRLKVKGLANGVGITLVDVMIADKHRRFIIKLTDIDNIAKNSRLSTVMTKLLGVDAKFQTGAIFSTADLVLAWKRQ